MLVATVFFVIGKPFYVNKPPEGSITTKVIGSISHATYKRFTSSDKKEHWMDHAKEKYEKSLVEDVKTLLRVLVIFIPIPVFWALFDQQVRYDRMPIFSLSGILSITRSNTILSANGGSLMAFTFSANLYFPLY